MRSKISEKDLQKWILEVFEYDNNIKLFRRNIIATKVSNGTGKDRFVRAGQPGQSDIWGIVKHYQCKQCNFNQNGIHIEIEIKSSVGKLTDYQMAWQEIMRKFNAIVLTIKPEQDDPIRLKQRIEELIYSSCPHCVVKSLNK